MRAQNRMCMGAKTGASKTGNVRHLHRKQKDEAGVSVSVEGVFGGDDSILDVKVKMIYDGGKEGDIINQYVAFTKIYNEQVKLHGRTREAVLETRFVSARIRMY